MSKEKQFAKLQKLRFDNQTWNDIRIENFQYHDKLIFRKIDKLFSDYIDVIKQAFNNKEKFHIAVYTERRDYSVNGYLGEDGIYRVWFSAEFCGMGNGKYYLLLNPTTAVFMEDD
jgi:hypothetical protein